MAMTLAPRASRGAGQTARARVWAKRAGYGFAAATIIALVVLWLANGGVTDLGAPGAPATTAGRLTGLIAADLLLLQILLMARIPPVERAWGQDSLTRAHRTVGNSSFYLMLAHIVLIVVGYTQAGTLSWPAELWNLTVDYPAMLLAIAGTAALIAVVVTSIRAARRRLRYESWHLIHLYAYLGVGLVLPHQLWTGADFLSSPAMTVFWWALWAAAAGSIVLFRLVLPLGRSLLHRLTVESVTAEAPGVQSVVVTGRNMAWLRPRPGQYFQWRFLTGPGWTRAHPYSVSATPDGRRLRVTMRTTGDEGARLSALRPGTRVLIEGPYGTLTAGDRRHRDVLLLAAGLGITPIRGLAEDIAAEAPADSRGMPPSVLVLHRVSRPADALFAAEWQALAGRHGVMAHLLAGPRGAGGSWLPAGAGDPARFLSRAVPDLARRDVYLCGPAPWMRAARGTLLALGVHRTAIHQESFGL